MAGIISGRVVDTNGTPVSGALVTVASSSVPVSDIASMTDADGQFRRSGLESGAYTLDVRKTGLGTHTIQVDVADGQQINLEIRLGDPENNPTNGTVIEPVNDLDTGTIPTNGSVPTGSDESNGALAVELQTQHIDWSQVRLVRVALDYPGSGRGDAFGRDYLLTAANHEAIPWEVPAGGHGQSTYTYEIEYFMADGTRRTVHSTGTSERTLVLDPTQ